MKPGILSIDIGGTNLKTVVIDPHGMMETARVHQPTPHPCTPVELLKMLAEMTASLPPFDRISVGFPGVVRDGVVMTAPNLGTKHWAGFALADALSKQFGKLPTKLINDADMQGFALISGQDVELVVTLGTGVGTALFRDGQLMPHIEMAHHPVYKNKTYDEYLGVAAYKKVGKKRWNKRVGRALALLEALFSPHRLFIGGGNAHKLDLDLPQNVTVGSNDAGLEGGAALWHKQGLKIAAVRHRG
jgi:polyphosphate glucokinase